MEPDAPGDHTQPSSRGELATVEYASPPVADLELLEALRIRWPGEKLYVDCDFSPHHHTHVQTWRAANAVELMFSPTYGSWLNWIESEFAALRYFAPNGTDDRTHTEQNAAQGDSDDVQESSMEVDWVKQYPYDP